MATRMQQRRGTALQWSTANPVLAAGEIGFETDTSKFKIGNGSSTWSALTYFANAADLAAIIDGAPAALNTLNELAAAMGDDPAFLTTIATNLSNHQSDTTDIHGIADTSELATLSDITDAIDGITGDYSLLAGLGIDWDADLEQFKIDDTVASKSYVDTEIFDHKDITENIHGIVDTTQLATFDTISSHNSDTTDVHGIASTADLATKNYADTAVSSHNSDTTDVHGIADTAALATITYAQSVASDAVATHASDSTSVHGIADTAELATKTYADGAVTSHNSNTTTAHGVTGEVVGTTNTQTLTNKTLTSPTINSPTGLIKSDVGLGNVDNTADTDKPVSSATQTALDLKANLAGPTFTGNVKVENFEATGTVLGVSKSAVGLGNVDNTSDANKPVSTATQTALDLKANLSAPTFTGTVTSTNDLVVDGNLTVNGTTFSASSTSITIEDNLVQLAHQNSGNTVDLGLVVAYNDGAAKHAGIARDVSDDKWKLFKGVTDEPSTTVNFSQGSLDTLAVGSLEATTVTPSSGVVFTDGTQTKEGVVSRTPIIQKTDSYTLSSLTERDSLIEVAKSSATTVTIPLNSAVAYPVGTSIDVLQTSTGQVTIAGAAGVTVNATPGLKLRTQWSSATLFKRAENTWVVYGDLTA